MRRFAIVLTITLLAALPIVVYSAVTQLPDNHLAGNQAQNETCDADAMSAMQMSTTTVMVNCVSYTPTPVQHQCGTPNATGALAADYALNPPWCAQPPQTQPAGAPAPVAGGPCPAWVHDRYAAEGPDGLWYPTYHAPIDPQYGCVFGHEHGDDPAGAPALQGRPVLFGFAGLSMGMIEAHPGFKVYRTDSLTPNANPTSSRGAALVLLIHQGSSNDNAFTHPDHELAIDYVNAADGRVIHARMVTTFGRLQIKQCGTRADYITRQAPGGGTRVIPGQGCVVGAQFPSGNQYEDWTSANYIGGDAQHNGWKVYADPHFAVFNPGRYCKLQADNTCQLGYTAAGIDPRYGGSTDPFGLGSWFKGDHREAYVNQFAVDNAHGPATFCTDAHGVAEACSVAGAITQYVAAVHVEPNPADGSNTIDSDANYDAGGSVHLPN